jgi:hypothetical protein
MIVVAGGCDGIQACPPALPFCACNSITARVDGYNPLTDTWVRLADMPSPRFRHRAALVGVEIFFVGGRDVNDNILQTVSRI